jgi:hypothetical protein
MQRKLLAGSGTMIHRFRSFVTSGRPRDSASPLAENRSLHFQSILLTWLHIVYRCTNSSTAPPKLRPALRGPLQLTTDDGPRAKSALLVRCDPRPPLPRPILNQRLPETPQLAPPTDAQNPGEEFCAPRKNSVETSTFAEPSNIQQSNIRCRANPGRSFAHLRSIPSKLHVCRQHPSHNTAHPSV